MFLIGISGKKQSGKTTIAEYLVNKRYDCASLCFADKIKEIIRDCFIPPEMEIDLNNPADKKIVLPCGYTPRELMQVVGTDYFRALYSDVWINAFRNELYLVEHYPIIIAPDVRFENEIEFIHSQGGKVIRLTRQIDDDPHESETALDYLINETEAWLGGYNDHAFIDPIKLHFDAIIRNKNMTIEQQCLEAERIIDGWFCSQKENDCAQ